jgi:CO/xanthine dehydrogenase Mo-binding subunit
MWPIGAVLGLAMSTHPPIVATAYHNVGLYGLPGVELGEERRRLGRQCHFVEVEVDTETGKVDITKAVNVNDVGKAINPGGLVVSNMVGCIWH